MSGSVSKQGNKWYYVIELGKDENGKRQQKKQRGFATKKEAEKAMREAITAWEKGTYIEPSKMLFREYITDWLNDKKNSVKKQTWEGYEVLIRTHIIPVLGNVKVSSLTPNILQKFINDLMDSHLAPSSVRKIYAILNNALSKAEKWGMIPKNVASLIEKPKLIKTEMKVWDKEEVNRFLDVAKEDRLHIAFLLAITTGMRQGEILGLKWEDIDFKEGTLSIKRILSHNGKELLSEGKTKSSIRTIYLDNVTIEALKHHRTMILQEKLVSGQDYRDHNLIICTTKGTSVNPRNLSRKWKELIKMSGIEEIRFHDLRHSHATLMMEQGVNPKVVAERLGHSDVRLTMNIYTHVLPSLQKQVAENFGKELFCNVNS
jgi:integrase